MSSSYIFFKLLDLLMLILAKKPNSKKKPNNMGRKELVNWEENH